MFSCMCRKGKSWDVPATGSRPTKVNIPVTQPNGTSTTVPTTYSMDTSEPVEENPVTQSSVTNVNEAQSTGTNVNEVQSTVIKDEDISHISSATDDDNIDEDAEPSHSSSHERKSEDKMVTSDIKRRSGLAGRTANVERKDVNSIEIVKHPKELSDEVLIKEAIANNEFLNRALEGSRLQAVVDAMYYREVKSNEVIIHEGSVGRQLYISASGKYEITIKNEVKGSFDDNRVFGELAILYDAKRQATIKALSDARLWVLDQSVYQQLMSITEIEHRNELLNFLRKVPQLNTVPEHVLADAADLLQKEFFSAGAVIVRQGDRGDKFYIISAGSVTVTKDGEGQVGKLGRGEFFGQLALLKDDVRQATVTADPPAVECFSLARPDFIKHFGNVKDIENVPNSDGDRRPTPAVINPYQDIQITDLKRIDTLGVGGFGRVELVQHKSHKDLTFALKYLKKVDMVQQQQQEHAYNEKIIQMACDSIFIVRLYKTFRDNKYLYFLMESCLGGDLWSLLQRQKSRRFEEPAARFFAASVLEALAYLHDRSIVYRDLKPENLLLDQKGYLKLTDFGFAKKLGAGGKTYTFAGTPEYVAPEIVLNRGHDRAVDYWALGIFIFELLVGKTPFRSNDTSYMKTYNLILRGIENVRFPEGVPRRAENLIKKLCRSLPTERLGCQKDGAKDVREHKWFLGFNWNQLNAGNLKTPFDRKLNSNVDTKYIDKFQKDSDIPPDELSGWDSNF